VGSCDAAGSQLFPILSEKDRRELSASTSSPKMCSILFDANGEPLNSPLTRRTMAIPYADLASIPEVIAVAGGVAKTAAIRAVLRGQAITSLVTDADVASSPACPDAHRRLLRTAGEPSRPS